jgi:hypothetical protein
VKRALQKVCTQARANDARHVPICELRLSKCSGTFCRRVSCRRTAFSADGVSSKDARHSAADNVAQEQEQHSSSQGSNGRYNSLDVRHGNVSHREYRRFVGFVMHAFVSNSHR